MLSLSHQLIVVFQVAEEGSDTGPGTAGCGQRMLMEYVWQTLLRRRCILRRTHCLPKGLRPLPKVAAMPALVAKSMGRPHAPKEGVGGQEMSSVGGPSICLSNTRSEHVGLASEGGRGVNRGPKIWGGGGGVGKRAQLTGTSNQLL